MRFFRASVVTQLAKGFQILLNFTFYSQNFVKGQAAAQNLWTS